MAADSSKLQTRASLLLRLRDASDVQAWRTFVEVYGPLIYRHSRGRGLKHEDAENTTQEVFAEVSRSIRKFEYQPDRGRFRDWLGTITCNKVNRFFRKEARAILGPGDRDQQEPSRAELGIEDTAWAEEFNAHIYQTALARSRPHFADRTWQAFELVWIEERPAAQVAQKLNMQLGMVYAAKSRVLERLRQEVKQLAEDTFTYSS